MPVVTTLHTVLKDPAPEYRDVMCKLSDLSDKLVVMSHKALNFSKISMPCPRIKLPLSITAFRIRRLLIQASQRQVRRGRQKSAAHIRLAFPNKGIENVLQALPAVIKNTRMWSILSWGQPTRIFLKSHGDAYRIMLQQLVRKLDIGEHVIFQNRFVELKELCEFLGIADIYVTPYLDEAQITSGTLAYAMGTGKAVISTPYWYATEMLAEGRGRIVPFNNPDAMARTNYRSSGQRCRTARHAQKSLYCSAVTRSGRRYPENISRFSVKFAKPHPEPPSPAFLC
jgi:glycosyltransferase involved in cell wall biosynthesis